MAAIPAWKQALLERKRQQEIQEKQKDNEEESRLAKLPPWKRDLILKKKQATVSIHNGSSPLINDNMSFGSVQVNKTEPRLAPVGKTCQGNEENRNVQINGSSSTVTCRDVYNANVANGHTTSLDNNGDSIESQESELQYQPGIVSKLRSRFKAEKSSEETVQLRPRSMTHETHDYVSSGLPRSTSSDTKIISRESKPSRVSPTINPPAKTNIHDNNNIPNGSVTLDSVDADADFSILSSNTTKDLSVKNKVSSILSVFETETSKSQSAGKRNSRTDLPGISYGVNKSSVINEHVAKRPESQLQSTTADITTSTTTTVTRGRVTAETTVAKQPGPKSVVRKSVDVKPDTETSDASLEKIRKAGNSWLFSADSTKTTSANQKPSLRHVTSDKPQEEIETSNTTIDDVPSFAVPPATLPSNGNHGDRDLTLDLNVAADDKKTGSGPSKKKAKPDKKSPTSPDKSKSKSEKVISPDKKKGFFGSLRKDKSKVKVVEVKTIEKSDTNPNFVVHGVDSPVTLHKRKAPVTPSAKTRAPAPPKAEPVRESKPLPQARDEETKPKANVPTSLPATERKTVVLQSNTFHVSPDSDIPVSNIDDVILDNEQTVTSSEPAQDNFDYDFLDGELAITPRPVKFSSVEFAGAGVKLDKSSLTKKVKGQKKNLKIQFEETSPETFEYPSEQSLLDSPGGQHPSTVGDGGGESSTDDSDIGDPDTRVTSTLSSNSAIGAGVLGGYRGKFVDDYQLGSKPPSRPADGHVVRARQNSTSDRESDSGDEVVINPADEDETFQWSESGTADILF